MFFKKKRILAPLLPEGLHGDKNLQRIVEEYLGESKLFIETGTNVGSTLKFIASKHPDVKCYSCEPDRRTYKRAKSHVKELHNVDLRNELSPDFLYNLVRENSNILNEKVVFWLDSHGYGFQWPLREEIEFITSNFKKFYVFIDDFQVPDISEFGFDVYEDQICNMEFINSYIKNKEKLDVVYPNYKDVTSSFHPLRGWVLISNRNLGDLADNYLKVN